MRWFKDPFGVYYRLGKETFKQYPLSILDIPLIELRGLPDFPQFVLMRSTKANTREIELKRLQGEYGLLIKSLID